MRNRDYNQSIINLAQELIRIKSYPGQEEVIIRFLEAKMKSLGFDEVLIDAMGNLLGRIGSGPKSIFFDSHVDTVEVHDEEDWEHPPFEGEILDGYLHGRGSVDMKSSVAASIFAAVIAKEQGLIQDKTIYVSCTVMEEDCDGENLKHLFKEFDLRPDYVIICEPSDNKIAVGHKGKAQVEITTHGISAHGAAPEKGVNAIYEMAEIIERVKQVNLELPKINGRKGTLVLSQISSVAASLNAVPSECTIYLDRRMAPGETEEIVKKEMDELIKGKNASWKVGVLNRKSWTGMDVKYHPFHDPWKIDKDHELTITCIDAFKKVFREKKVEFDFWDFSTNAVTPTKMGIPTIGFGPGDYRMAHMRDERCVIRQIEDACDFYMEVIGRI